MFSTLQKVQADGGAIEKSVSELCRFVHSIAAVARAQAGASANESTKSASCGPQNSRGPSSTQEMSRGAGVAGNIRLGGVVGMGVDGCPRQAPRWVTSPTVVVTLQPVAPPPVAAPAVRHHRKPKVPVS